MPGHLLLAWNAADCIDLPDQQRRDLTESSDQIEKRPAG